MTASNAQMPSTPLMEFISEEEFTNRQQELAFLWELANRATLRRASSYALIARKGMGKTALMLEFYRQLFTRQRNVVPFYISFSAYQHRSKTVQLTLEKFISTLFVNFAFQYGAFKSDRFPLPPELPELISKQKEFFSSFGDSLLEEEYLGHLHALETNDIEGAFDQAIRFASSFTSRRGEPGIVMIDEFQVLTEVYDRRYQKLRNVTEWFQKPAEARWCPMVVSGSAVSLFTKTVMGGLLARRFGPYHLEPFDRQHSLEYAYKLAHAREIKLSEEVAAEIHRLTGGNPYYIGCLFNSVGLQDKNLSTLDKIEKLYTYETVDANGEIRQFWDIHFSEFTDKINDDKIGLQCLYQLAVAKKEIRIDDIATTLGAAPEHVRQVLKNLEQADLIARQIGSIYPVYHRITDPILANYIEREYQVGLIGKNPDAFLQSQLKALRKQMGSVARLLGEAAELYTRHLLMSFAGQEVDAREVFNLPTGKIKLPKFKKVEHRSGLIIAGDVIEFDLLAEGEESWLVEVRYRKKPVRVNHVEQFMEKTSKLKGWQAPLGPGKRLWFFSRSGFDNLAKERLRELQIFHSDIFAFNALCRAVNIGEVPV